MGVMVCAIFHELSNVLLCVESSIRQSNIKGEVHDTIYMLCYFFFYLNAFSLTVNDNIEALLYTREKNGRGAN